MVDSGPFLFLPEVTRETLQIVGVPSRPVRPSESKIMSSPSLARQGSIAKNNGISSCLCSPTTHAGSFRCRLHRTPTLRRSKSTEPSSYGDLQYSNKPGCTSSAGTC
ncbi:uncharacterized protein LOC127797833 [Diospyros lotus]|uniref:uncharacterized protein LOC127797833 n=1 Tax=Diospyros lotus TaxID=55363 RepID=UPI00225344C8|nr:uncharacterized protein LOC127797833 [Diospyros lotus]